MTQSAYTGTTLKSHRPPNRRPGRLAMAARRLTPAGWMSLVIMAASVAIALQALSFIPK